MRACRYACLNVYKHTYSLYTWIYAYYNILHYTHTHIHIHTHTYLRTYHTCLHAHTYAYLDGRWVVGRRVGAVNGRISPARTIVSPARGLGSYLSVKGRTRPEVRLRVLYAQLQRLQALQAHLQDLHIDFRPVHTLEPLQNLQVGLQGL